MAQRPDQERPPATRSVSDEFGLPISAVINENWQGKSDPTERRRIQNRLNQRNYRARQRAGSTSKQYRPRGRARRQASRRDGVVVSAAGATTQEPGTSAELASSARPSLSAEAGPSSSSGVGSSTEAGPSECTTSETTISETAISELATSRSSSVSFEGRSISAPAAAGQPHGLPDVSAGVFWDELALLINRNLMQAAITNAQHVGIGAEDLKNQRLVRTPRSANANMPATLTPVELQHRYLHDPIFDVLPHARLRHNMINAVVTYQANGETLARCIRISGTLQDINGAWSRGGMIVWGYPEQMESWELSETFVRQWSALLQGCDDLVAVTNSWRQRRGERLLSLPFPPDTAGGAGVG